MTSERQIKANQKNGKLGGTKSPEVSKNNSLKHGILSNNLVVSHKDLREDGKLLKEIRERFYSELKPENILESALVDKMIVTYWKQQRIEKAEKAELIDNIDSQRTALLKSEKEAAIRMFFKPREHHHSTRFGNHYYLQMVFEYLHCSKTHLQQSSSAIPEDTLLNPLMNACFDYYEYKKLESVRNMNQGLNSDGTDQELRDKLINLLSEIESMVMIDFSLASKDFDERIENLYSKVLLLHEYSFDKFTRYSTAYENQFYKASTHLMEIRRAKRNGFVS